MIIPTTTLDELCDLISVQILALENPEPLTSDQLCEFQSRSEKIRVLCEELDEMNTTEPMKELALIAA